MKKGTRLMLMLTAVLIGGGAASVWLLDTLDAQGVALPADVEVGTTDIRFAQVKNP